ncbi:MAG: hypothetical protein RBT46_04575 [Weeksellaceae bacterium]|jgi:hypothetical protein|nr:hypothetical protein [Weeksellaceae bacterium]MDX9704967.1 hypothetical protein [Weeksellaceae bacterium]
MKTLIRMVFLILIFNMGKAQDLDIGVSWVYKLIPENNVEFIKYEVIDKNVIDNKYLLSITFLEYRGLEISSLKEKEPIIIGYVMLYYNDNSVYYIFENEKPDFQNKFYDYSKIELELINKSHEFTDKNIYETNDLDISALNVIIHSKAFVQNSINLSSQFNFERIVCIKSMYFVSVFNEIDRYVCKDVLFIDQNSLFSFNKE